MAYHIDKDWLIKNVDAEDGMCISAGSPIFLISAANKTKSTQTGKRLRRAVKSKVTNRKKQSKKSS